MLHTFIHIIIIYRYVASGLQAVLELYFVRFLFVCLGARHRTSLGTTCTNVYIALYQVCAISAGILADKLIGTNLNVYLLYDSL